MAYDQRFATLLHLTLQTKNNMKLSQDSVRRLKTLLQTVSLVKIDRLIIEGNLIRGVDEDQTVVIVSDQNVPDFGGCTVGLNRLSILASRIALFDANEDFNVDATEAASRDGEGTDISSFKLAAKGSKFEYRCARAGAIKAPKQLNDSFVWAVTVPVDAVKVAISASNTMGSEQIALVSKASGEVLFEIVDGETQDSFTTKIADEAVWLADDEDQPTQSFVHYYAVKALMPLLKAASTQGDPVLQVGEEGMLQITVNGYTMTLLPRESE
jgi:hypothetical protein